MRYFIEIAYDGTNYHGWQKQNNAVSVQETIEKAIFIILRKPVELTVASRTDTGVHAKQNFAHFDFDELKDNFLFRLNCILPSDIKINNIFRVSENANARFDALSRTYQYIIIKNKNPFLKNFSFHFYYNLNIDIMNSACQILFEFSDFTSFAKLHANTKNNICKILFASWNISDDQIIFTIKSNRFLRNMVRAITGTMLEIGKGNVSLDRFRKIIELKNRNLAGSSVPAKGLFLTEVYYPPTINHLTI